VNYGSHQRIAYTSVAPKSPTSPFSGPSSRSISDRKTLNGEPELPVYGCCVVGENWRFMALVGREYSISLAFSAITDEVFYILGLLKSLKVKITAHIGAL
jgi:hypothetical protein